MNKKITTKWFLSTCAYDLPAILQFLRAWKHSYYDVFGRVIYFKIGIDPALGDTYMNWYLLAKLMQK